MRIGLLKEEKKPADERVVLTPQQCKVFKTIYTNIDLVVMSSDIRCFSDELYRESGVEVVNDLSDCDILLGVKEVPKNLLIPNKKYCYFSHTIKKQEYNRELLLKMIGLNITMIDYEILKDTKGRRLLGFGRYAGIVGAYNGFLTYGLKSGRYKLKPANKCFDRLEMEGELEKINLKDEKIIITGNGRVGNGIMEIMKRINIREVSKEDFANQIFDEAVFVHLDTMDYNVRINGSESFKSEFYDYPELYRSSFMDYAKYADIFIAGHYYGTGSPYLFTREDAKSKLFNLKVIADISCDIDGPVASTIRPSTINSPIYGYNPETETEDDFMKEGVVAVMAVDNLPCELPKDASEDFGNEMLEKILPILINGDNHKTIADATICEKGDLTTSFEYLRDYINGN
ncbi:MAG: alanine dehydrogenase [Flavobacteriales bacterium]|nr:alanine dehydrogenase [Flavobacteriales bacterium]|tara:strand:- start:3746 stop:4948 length:1203 start_codon:yes stop_codon:yes gene_type:complete